MRQNIETMRELVDQLASADIAYYKHDDPIMTDREYDALYGQLVDLEQSTVITLSGSPTEKASGEVVENLAQVRHTRPMLSARRTKSIDEIIEFIGGRKAFASWKLDGLSLVLRYENGKLKQALTRGGEGGMTGEDVTHSVRAMLNVPLTIPLATAGSEVLGICMSLNDIARLLSQHRVSGKSSLTESPGQSRSAEAAHSTNSLQVSASPWSGAAQAGS